MGKRMTGSFQHFAVSDQQIFAVKVQFDSGKLLISGKITILEGVLILRNSSLKLKMVADNAILLNYTVSSENISECKK